MKGSEFVSLYTPNRPKLRQNINVYLSLSPYDKFAISRLKSQNLPKENSKGFLVIFYYYHHQVWVMTSWVIMTKTKHKGWFEMRKLEV